MPCVAICALAMIMCTSDALALKCNASQLLWLSKDDCGYISMDSIIEHFAVRLLLAALGWGALTVMS